jgi:hypothetical protein
MSTRQFDRLWQAIKELPPQQQGRLRRLLKALRNASQPRTPAQEADLLLLADGTIRRIPAPPSVADVQDFRTYAPINVQGKSVSETIMEERR